MKQIFLEQGSPEWLSWRRTVITATDCSSIRGSSPWSTAYKTWQKKLGLIEEEKSNYFMERGKRLEPVIRDRFIRNYGINMTPVVVESSEYEFLAASLDGLSDCGKYILEVKTGKEELYLMAMEGRIPPYYMDQMQQQLLVTGCEKCFYKVGSEDEGKDVVIEVYPDAEFAKEYVPQARAFFKCIAFSEPPALQDRDYKDMNDSPRWITHSEQYRNLCDQIKSLEEVKELHRQELISMSGDQCCLGSGIRVMRMCVKGRVDYDKIPEIKQIDIDKYRKPSSVTWKIMVA